MSSTKRKFEVHRPGSFYDRMLEYIWIHTTLVETKEKFEYCAGYKEVDPTSRR